MLQQSLDAEAEGDDLDAVASKGLTGNISRVSRCVKFLSGVWQTSAQMYSKG